MNTSTDRLDAAIVGIVPSTVEEGIKELKQTLVSILHSFDGWERLKDVEVNVYTDWSDPRKFMFVYHYWPDSSLGPQTGVYHVDTRFWECRFKE
jgi:hypothetical protein